MTGPGSDAVAFPAALFALAREDDAATPSASLDAGVSPDLINGTGESLLLLAAYHDYPDAGGVLLDMAPTTPG